VTLPSPFKKNKIQKQAVCFPPNYRQQTNVSFTVSLIAALHFSIQSKNNPEASSILPLKTFSLQERFLS
jgi:hypothetical protein